MSTPSMLSAVQKLRTLLSREEKWIWLGIVGFAVCVSILEIITASIVIVFAQVLSQPTSVLKYVKALGIEGNIGPERIVFYTSVCFGLIYFIKNVINACEVFYQNFSIQKMNFNFKGKLLDRYANMDYGFFLTRNSSYSATVMGGEVEYVFSIGMVALATMISEGLIFIFLVGMLIYVNPLLAIMIGVIGSMLGLFIVKKLLPLFYDWGKRMQASATLTSQNLYQFFHGFKEIILFGKRKNFITSYQYYAYQRSKIQAMQTATHTLPRMAIEILFVGILVLTIAYLCFDHESPQQLMGVLGGYLYAGFRLMPGLNRIIAQLSTFKAAIPSIDQVYYEYTTVTAKESYENNPDFEFENLIALNNMSFKYLNTQKEALTGVNFVIKKGECIGIIGETGSGKSTLVDLILGLLKPTSGTILVDHKHSVTCYQWHQKIGYVPQAIYLMDDTIKANIAFGENLEDIDLKKLEKAIQDAQLTKFINQLPQGIDTIIGERGVRLSGGERQRIAIARALYINPEILIFDEATSALDTETESRLMETIHKVSKNHTVIMIAHRLSTLKECDRIIVMKNGCLEKITTYDHLQVEKAKDYV